MYLMPFLVERITYLIAWLVQSSPPPSTVISCWTWWKPILTIDPLYSEEGVECQPHVNCEVTVRGGSSIALSRCVYAPGGSREISG